MDPDGGPPPGGEARQGFERVWAAELAPLFGGAGGGGGSGAGAGGAAAPHPLSAAEAAHLSGVAAALAGGQPSFLAPMHERALRAARALADAEVARRASRRGRCLGGGRGGGASSAAAGAATAAAAAAAAAADAAADAAARAAYCARRRNLIRIFATPFWPLAAGQGELLLEDVLPALDGDD